MPAKRYRVRLTAEERRELDKASEHRHRVGAPIKTGSHPLDGR